MAKPALGKGLGQLMQGQRVSGRESGAVVSAPGQSGSEKTIEVEFGRGLNSLVVTAAHVENPEAAPKKEILPAWFFYSADLLLLAYTVAICFDAEHPFDGGTIAFCTASVSLAALMGITGVLRSR